MKRSFVVGGWARKTDVMYGRSQTKTKVFSFSLYPMPQEAPLHLLGRNHPLVKEAERIPFKQSHFKGPIFNLLQLTR